MNALLQSRTEGHRLDVVFGNGRRKNALSRALLAELTAVFAAPDDQVKIAFMRGTGGVFSAGADLNDIRGTADDAAYDDDVTTLTEAIRRFPAPVVAVIEGPCMGAAVHLALACDLRIAVEGATFAVPATELGLLYNPDAIARLHGRLPAETLTRLFVLGERFSASDAPAAGLAGETVAPEGLDRRMTELVDQVSKNDAHAAALTKQLLDDLDRGTADLAAWQEIYRDLLDTPARAEAVATVKKRLGLNESAAGSPEKFKEAQAR